LNRAFNVWCRTEALILPVLSIKGMSARIKYQLFRLLGLSPSFSFGIAAAPTPSSIDREDFVRIRRLLAEFVLPKSANAVARSPYWRGLFHEPVMTILRRLQAKGLLVEPNDPHARMRCDRDESDLRMLCLEFGLPPTGSIDQLVDRLLTIDPTGWLLGYAGELLQCSDVAVRTMIVPA
jgi:hypothetical protein